MCPLNWTDKLPNPIRDSMTGEALPGAPGSISHMPKEVQDALGPLAGEMAKQEKEEEEQRLRDETKQDVVLTIYNHDARPIPGMPMERLAIRKTSENQTLDEAIADVKSGLTGVLVDRPARFTIGKGHEFQTQSKTRGGDTHTNVIFVMVDGPDRWTFSFITARDPVAIIETAQPMIETFRITK